MVDVKHVEEMILEDVEAHRDFIDAAKVVVLFLVQWVFFFPAEEYLIFKDFSRSYGVRRRGSIHTAVSNYRALWQYRRLLANGLFRSSDGQLVENPFLVWQAFRAASSCSSMHFKIKPNGHNFYLEFYHGRGNDRHG